MIGVNENQETSALSRPGLQMLLQALDYAHELDRDVWEFAVELPVLQKAGLSSSDLRWLVCKGYADHAREITSESNSGRSFRYQKNLAMWKRSCFVLTNLGVDFAQNSDMQLSTQNNESTPPRVYSSRLQAGAYVEGDNSATNGERDGSAARTDDCKSMTPTWDCDRQELRLGPQVVKEFRLRSPNQVTILTAFEEEEWPAKIDDPLPPHTDIDVKQRLHDTIKSLNRNQKRPLIRFRGDGTGEGIRWELRELTCE